MKNKGRLIAALVALVALVGGAAWYVAQRGTASPDNSDRANQSGRTRANRTLRTK